jgi:nucleotide-binding universal stress UspA family protein
MAKIAIEPASNLSEGGTKGPAEAAVREILFPADLSRPSDLAFGHARLLAEGLGARLTVYHAVEKERGVQDPVAAEVERRTEGGALEHLEFLLDGVNARWSTFVETGDSASRVLLRFMRSHAPDLVVMATHGREGLSHLFLGSVTETVLRERRSPVLCIREPEHGAALPYRRVLVPSDLSDASRKALPWAALLARTFEGEVLVTHFAECPTPASLSGVPSLVEEAFPSEADVRRFVEPYLEGRRVAVQLHVGRQWDRMIDVARSQKADVIVVSGAETRVETLVRHAPCPVLVV